MADGRADVVIVGSGAGGGVAAFVLASRGKKVVLLEKGRSLHPRLDAPVLAGTTLGNDEIRLRRHYGMQDPFLEPRLFRLTDDVDAQQSAFQRLGVCLGGGTVHYDGDSPRLTRADLRLQSTYGDVEGANVVDWPLDYDELAPFYDAAEQAIGVQGTAGDDPHAEPRGPYPMPAGAPSRSGLVLSEGARSLGYHPHAMPMAINSIAYRGRPACVNCGFCNHGCPANAKCSTAVTVIRDALLTGNLELVTESCALTVETTASGEHATGVRYLDAAGDERLIEADQVMVACNAIETPRLLLLSSSAAHPDGLGNGSGLVGRNLMFHVIFQAVGIFAEELRPYRSRTVTHALSDLMLPDGDPSWVRGGYVELGGSIHPVESAVQYPMLFAKSLLMDGKYWKNVGSVTMIGEDVPVSTNRVDLDDRAHDVYGRPAARVTYRRHAHDQAVADYYMPKLVAIARAAGAREVLEIDQDKDGAPDTKHLLGTTRMGDDPATSVCDRYGRLHEVDNVWIADGGVFPTSTAFNPTLTQQALAWRTAAFIADPEDVRP